MTAPSSFDPSLARLLLDWITNALWTEELFNLIEEFLESIRLRPVPRPSFADKGEEATAQKKELREELELTAATFRENAAFDALASRFSLSVSEIELLRFFNLYLVFQPLEDYMDKLPEWEIIKRIARFISTGQPEALDAIRSTSRLVISGIGSTDGHALRLKKLGITFGVPKQVLDFIAAEDTRSLSSFMLETPQTQCLPLSAHDLPEPTIAAARATLRSSRGKALLLIYGNPGTGKSEFARSISASCGYIPCFLTHDRTTGKRSYSDLLLAARLIDPEHEVLVVDEADELLNLEPRPYGGESDNVGIKKSMINDFLDSTTARIIFITNATRRIPDSILRRFSFHLRFRDFNYVQRARVWNSLDDAPGIFSVSDRSSLAARYRANPSRIKQVLDVCASLRTTEGLKDGEAIYIAEEMLARGDEIMYGIPRREKRTNVAYNLAFLNLAVPAEVLLASLDHWKIGFVAKKQGLNLLFFGAPGTGKTAFALHLADHLGFQPIVKRASDLLSSWVGETEIKIREAFREAEGSVLIFDEADSLIASREDARAGWERTMTNEVLTCMEDFKGVFIASTNFMKILDSASLRRFTYKIEFRPTAAARRKDLVESYFPDISLSSKDAAELVALDSLTPGDVSVVARRLEFASTCDASRILAALREEVESHGQRQARVGFTV